MRITREEFDAALETLRREGRGGIQSEGEARVFLSASFVIRKRRGIPDEQPWQGPTDEQLADLIDALDPPRWRRLKRIAEELEVDPVRGIEAAQRKAPETLYKDRGLS